MSINTIIYLSFFSIWYSTYKTFFQFAKHQDFQFISLCQPLGSIVYPNLNMSELLPKYKLPHSKLFDARGNIPENSHNCKFHYVFQTYCLGLRNAVKSTGTNFGTFRSYSLSQILFLEIGNHPQRKVS